MGANFGSNDSVRFAVLAISAARLQKNNILEKKLSQIYLK
jgi:hypothetical protein